MENPLSKLALDYWYQVLMVVSAIVFLMAGAGVLKAFPVVPTAAISAGLFFVSMGEWINHPLQTRILPPTAYRPGGVISGHPRSNSVTGIAFVLVGFALCVFGAYRAFV